MLNKYATKHKYKMLAFAKFDPFFSFNKSIVYNRRLSYKLRSFILSNNIELGKTMIRNCCIVNNRSRAVYSKLNLSRIPLKTYTFAGYLNGFFRGTW